MINSYLSAAHEEYSGLKAQTSAQQQTAQLIELVLTKGNAAAEVFRNWIQKNDVHLLRDLMGTSRLSLQIILFIGVYICFNFALNYMLSSILSAQSNEAASPSQDLSGMKTHLQAELSCQFFFLITAFSGYDLK